MTNSFLLLLSFSDVELYTLEVIGSHLKFEVHHQLSLELKLSLPIMFFSEPRMLAAPAEYGPASPPSPCHPSGPTCAQVHRDDLEFVGKWHFSLL